MRTPNLQPRVFPNLRHAGRTTSKMMKQPVWKIWPMARHQDDPGRKMLEIHGNHCLENAYPLVNVNKKRWKITIFNGKTHYNWGIFNSYVKLPEGSSSKQFCPGTSRNHLTDGSIWRETIRNGQCQQLVACWRKQCVFVLGFFWHDIWGSQNHYISLFYHLLALFNCMPRNYEALLSDSWYPLVD